MVAPVLYRMEKAEGTMPCQKIGQKIKQSTSSFGFASVCRKYCNCRIFAYYLHLDYLHNYHSIILP